MCGYELGWWYLIELSESHALVCKVMIKGWYLELFGLDRSEQLILPGMLC